MMDAKSYFDGPGAEKKAPVEAKKPMGEPDGDEPVATITVHKKPEGGHTFTHDSGDGMSEEHDSVAELAKSLEEKYGENQTEEAEEHVSPGVHEKAGSYLEKMKGMA